MKSKLISSVVAGALGVTVALTSPVQARGGGGGMGGGMHGGGMGGGMHAGDMGGGMRFGGNRFAGADFAGTHFVIRGSSPGLQGSPFETIDFSAIIALLS
jgi:hypothetical protein